MNYGGASLADIAAVTRGNNDGGFGDGNGWWVLIILFALFGNWGGNSYGNNGGGCSGELQRGFDNQTVMGSLRGIENGICSLGYDQLNQMNGINTNVMQTGFGLQNAINALATQLADCCCKEQVGQLQLQNQMQSNTCAVTNAIQQAARDIMQNDNCNYRQLHDENVALQMQNYQREISDLKVALNDARRDASQIAQTEQIVNRTIESLSRCPVGTYNVPNPNCCYGPWGANNWTGFYPQNVVYTNGGCNSCNGNQYGFVA